MPDLMSITQEQYEEYKALKHFYRETHDAYAALKQHIIKLKLMANGIFYSNEKDEGLIDIIAEMIINMAECSQNVDDVFNASANIRQPLKPEKNSVLRLTEPEIPY